MIFHSVKKNKGGNNSALKKMCTLPERLVSYYFLELHPVNYHLSMKNIVVFWWITINTWRIPKHFLIPDLTRGNCNIETPKSCLSKYLFHINNTRPAHDGVGEYW